MPVLVANFRFNERGFFAMKRLEHQEYLPSPRQIAAESAAIRCGWSGSERRRRRVGFEQLAAQARWALPQLFATAQLAPVRLAAQASA